MNIRDLRKAAGLTQRELAERVNVTQGAVSRWENDRELAKEVDRYERRKK